MAEVPLSDPYAGGSLPQKEVSVGCYFGKQHVHIPLYQAGPRLWGSCQEQSYSTPHPHPIPLALHTASASKRTNSKDSTLLPLSLSLPAQPHPGINT